MRDPLPYRDRPAPRVTMPRWDGVAIAQTVALERIGDLRFRSCWAQRNRNDILFGGQLLGLALMAASRVVEGRAAHAMQGFFLAPASPEAPVVLDVEMIRVGGSFSVYRVIASQGERICFHLECSFQADEAGVEHGGADPGCGNPDDATNMEDFVTREGGRLAGHILHRFARTPAVELRPVDPERYVFGGVMPEPRRVWVRAPSAAAIVDAAVHRALLAYLSDFLLAGTVALTAFPATPAAGLATVAMATLNQAVWFHRPFRIDEWLLLDGDSPSVRGGRGLARGTFRDRQGRVVASAVQEVLLRQRRKSVVGEGG